MYDLDLLYDLCNVSSILQLLLSVQENDFDGCDYKTEEDVRRNGEASKETLVDEG